MTLLRLVRRRVLSAFAHPPKIARGSCTSTHWRTKGGYASVLTTCSSDADPNVRRNFSSYPVDHVNVNGKNAVISSERVKLSRNEPLFDKVNRVIDVPMGELHPLDVSFTCIELMVDCCKLNTLEGMKHAQDILDRLLAEKRHVNSELKPDSEQPMVVPAAAFEKLMYGWATMAKHVNVAVIRMREVLELMEREDEYDKQIRSNLCTTSLEVTTSEKVPSCQPTVYSFNVMLRGLADAARGSPDLASEAESLLDTMNDYHDAKRWHTKPNTRSYTHVITAFGNTHADFGGKRAEQLLERMKKIHKEERERYEVEFGSAYNTVVPKGNVIQIVTPDLYVYSAVITAHGNSGGQDSAEKAHSLLLQLVESKDALGLPDAAVFGSAINAWANAAGNRPSPKARFEAAEHAEQLLLLLIDLADRAEARGVVSSESVLDKREAYEESEQDNRYGTSLAPNVITYNSVLNAWANSDTREAAPRAEALLQRMLEASMTDETAVRPDRISFNSVLNAWARFSAHDAESPQKAEDLMSLMYDLYHSGRLDESAKPDSTTYTTVINAWARGGDDNVKTMKSRLLLDAMLHKYEAGEYDMKPTAASFTSVLNAAAHTTESPANGVTDDEGFVGRSEAVDPYTIALQTYEDLWNDHFDLKLKPDHLAFATMLKVVERHTDVSSTERRQMVERIFDDACARGQVSSFVVRALKEACPSIELLERLMGSRKLARHLKSVDELPREWSRHVDRGKRFRVVDTKGSAARGSNKKKKRKRTDRSTRNIA